jgi:hypothetical protein
LRCNYQAVIPNLERTMMKAINANTWVPIDTFVSLTNGPQWSLITFA